MKYELYIISVNEKSPQQLSTAFSFTFPLKLARNSCGAAKHPTSFERTASKKLEAFAADPGKQIKLGELINNVQEWLKL